MRVLFITAHKYLPQMRGGLQSSTDQLCQVLIARGHKVSVLAGLLPGGIFALRARVKCQINGLLSGCKVGRDMGQGYPVWYAWCPWEAIGYVAKQEKPDVIVVMAMQTVRMALAAKSSQIPLLIQLQDVEFAKHAGPFEAIADLSSVANSQFTASRYQEAFGSLPAVIQPFILSAAYRTESTRDNVTFINPVPEKGLEIALEVASRCPDIPFAFVEAWPLESMARRDLMRRLSMLPNVAFLPPQSDMRKVYARCKILLVPSIWEEAYGRVVTEAQISGIPAVASSRGGLPEAVGIGGILLDPAGPVEPWIAAVRKLWQDGSYYARLSAAALNYAQRREMTPDYKAEAWEGALRAAIASTANPSS